jgi:hypothetical protein
MRKLPWFAPLLFLFAAAGAAAQLPAAATLIEAARLVDPRTGEALAPAAVLIEDGKIKQVGTPAQVKVNAPAAVRAAGSAGEAHGLQRRI